MDFLKDVFGDKALTYDELQKALEGNEEIKIGNLAGGAYVGKEKFDSKDSELIKANELIKQLKGSNVGNEDLQAKIDKYEKDISTLKTALSKEKLDGAVKTALIKADAIDIEYLTYKLNEKGELRLDENGKVTGLEDLISGLKTELPTFFKAEAEKNVLEKPLEKGNPKEEGVTKEQFEKMGYLERNELQKSDPKTYSELAKGE